MTSDIDIYRVAKQYIDLHGENAGHHAAECYYTVMGAGDLEGMRVWRRVSDAIRELRAKSGRADK